MELDDDITPGGTEQAAQPRASAERRSLRPDAISCSTWQDVREAGERIGFPIELSIRKAIAAHGMSAAASSIPLRRYGQNCPLLTTSYCY